MPGYGDTVPFGHCRMCIIVVSLVQPGGR